VLLALADGPKHGYLVIKDVQERTDGEVRAEFAAETDRHLRRYARRSAGDGVIETVRMWCDTPVDLVRQSLRVILA
jgi:hypothetical protein